MANDDWGSDLPPGPAPATNENANESENKGPPTWSAPSFANLGSAPKGVIPAPSDAPRPVTLEKPAPTGSSPTVPPVSVPKTPYPLITESFQQRVTPEVRPAPPKPEPARRERTLIYGTPALPDLATPIGPATHDPHSLANDDDDTVLNPVAPSEPHAASAPKPAAVTPDPRAAFDAAALAQEDTVLHPQTVAQTPANHGIHSALTEDQATAEDSNVDSRPAASGPDGTPLTFDDDTTKAAYADGPMSPKVGPEETAAANPRGFTDFDDPSRTELGSPSVTAMFFNSPPKNTDEGAAIMIAPDPEPPKPDVVTAKPASKMTPTAAPAPAARESFEPTDRIDRAPARSPIASPLSDDDDDLALVGRSRRNAMLVAAALGILLVGGIGTAFALGVFDPKPEQVAQGPRRDITKDPRRELYTDGTAQPVDGTNPKDDGKATGDDAATEASVDAAKASEQKAAEEKGAEERRAAEAKAAEAKAAEDDRVAAAKAADANAAEQKAAEKKAAAQKAAEAQAEKERVAEAKAAEAKAAKEKAAQEKAEAKAEADEAKAASNSGRRRRTKRGRSTSEESTAAAAPATKDVVVKTLGPKHVRWRTTAGKELGRGNGTLTLAAGAKTIVAFDPIRGVKTRVSVSDGETIDYAALPSGTLDLRVFPFADVYIGADKVGTTPFAPVRVLAGTYEVKFVHEGETRKESVTVRAGKIKRIKVNFNAP